MISPRISSIVVLVLSLVAWPLSVRAADGTCYVDSVSGDDGNDGQTEDSAWASTEAIESSCTTVRFKRGSEFAVPFGEYAIDLMQNSQLRMLGNYGDPNLPLPRFTKQRQASSGGMLASYMGDITIDGLYLSGSQSDASMSNLGEGICVMLGQNSTLINSEITLCDIGIMTMGDNVVVRDNYIHDLFISVDGDPGIDPNAVGGAEGIFVNSSHVEVAYNRFVNCTIPARWVSDGSTRCDGGATEVTVPYGEEVTNVRIHHNFSYNSCGFFEVASMFQSAEDQAAGLPYQKGLFSDSVFHNNVMVDSGWVGLLQINNTKLSNVRWENNTIVHHDLGVDENGVDLNDYSSSRMMAIAFNATSSGVTGGGEISPGDIAWTNNLWYFDPTVAPFSLDSDEFLSQIVRTTDLVFTEDPGFVDVNGTTDPLAFDLSAGSAAIDVGTALAELTLDYLDRPAPVNQRDVGAFEWQGASAGGAPGAGGIEGTGGTPLGEGGDWGTGGAVSGAGGDGAGVAGAGGAGAGGAPEQGGSVEGGENGQGGEVVAGGGPGQGGDPAGGGLATTGSNANGGALLGDAGTSESAPALGGAEATGVAGVPSTAGAGFSAEADSYGLENGCGCRINGVRTPWRGALGALLLAAFGLGRLRRR